MFRLSTTIMTCISFFSLSILLFLPSHVLCQRQQQRIDRECNPISNQMKSKGFSYPWWNSSITEEANGCPAVGTGQARSAKCCKSFQVPTLMNETQKGFTERWLGPKLEAQAKVFNESKSRFDLTFKALLTRAHTSFDAMFEKT